METILIGRRKLGLGALLVLIAAIFFVDFAHGIWVGEYQIAYHPIYRLRQSLAIAVSRLHTPAPGGYLAYKSVVDVFNRNGFAIFPDDPGQHLDVTGWEQLFSDSARLNRILREARNVAVDPSLPPEIVRGNEIGYVDYIYLAFRLFGLKMSSLYYLYFLCLGSAVGLFIIEFRRSPFLLFILALYLAELFFLENYAPSKGAQLGAIQNSRLFDALTLLPAIHVFLAIWLKRRTSWRTLGTVAFQSVLLAFLVACRTTANWELLMIGAAAVAVTLIDWPASLLPSEGPYRTATALRVLWPAAVVMIAVVAITASGKHRADSRYAGESENHIIWHEVLMGMLSTSPQLRQQYTDGHQSPYTDTIVYDAVLQDLNRRHDSSSPIATVSGGQISINLWGGWGYYDALCRSLTFRIIRDHPLWVIIGLYHKVWDQLELYASSNTELRWSDNTMSVRNLMIPVALALAAIVAFAFAGGFSAGGWHAHHAAVALIIVLISALIPVAIEPSTLSVGTMVCYMIAVVVVATYAAMDIARRIRMCSIGGLGAGASE